MPLTAIAFISIFTAGLVATLFFHASYGVLLYQLTYFLNPGGRWWGTYLPDFSWSFLIALIVIAGFILQQRQYQWRSFFKSGIALPLCLFILNFLLVYFVAVRPEAHWLASERLLKLFIIAALIMLILIRYKDLLNSAWVYVLGCTYVGYEAYIRGRNGFERVEGIGTVDMPDANGISAALVPAIPLLILLVWRSSMAKKIVAAVCAAFVVNGIVLINSRGSFIGAAVASGIFVTLMVFAANLSSKQRVGAVLLIVLGIGAGLHLADDTFWNRMYSILEVEDEGKSGSHRVKFWMATFDMLEDYPAGLGAEGYITLSTAYLEETEWSGAERARAVHSSWFQALGEGGYSGLLLFIWLVVAVYKSYRGTMASALRRDDMDLYFLTGAFMSGFIGYLAAGSFIDIVRTEVAFWFIAFAGACRYVSEIPSNETARENVASSKDRIQTVQPEAG